MTLKYGPYYSAFQRSSVIKRTCFEDRKWKLVRLFNSEPECRLWGTSLLTGGFIANGEIVEYATRFPWHFKETALQTDDFEYTCGGSLIDRNIILTAAHCPVDNRGDPLVPQMLKAVMNAPSADFQENGKNDATQIFQVEQIWRPWSLDYKTLHCDIAIIHLKTPATCNNYVRPICYLQKSSERFPTLNSTGKASGFGLIDTGEISLDLKYVELMVTQVKSNVTWRAVETSFVLEPQERAKVFAMATAVVALCFQSERPVIELMCSRAP